MEEAVEGNEHYKNYVLLMKKIDDFANLIERDKDDMYKIAFETLEKIRSPCRTLIFSLH